MPARRSILQMCPREVKSLMLFQFRMNFNSTSLFRVSKDWNFEEHCVPLTFTALFNLTKAASQMKICENLVDPLEFYTTNISPYVSGCNEICEAYQYSGAMTATIPSTAPIEVCYWLRTNKLMVSEEFLIYDFKSMIASIGGVLGLFLGFSLMGLTNSIFEAFLGCCRI